MLPAPKHCTKMKEYKSTNEIIGIGIKCVCMCVMYTLYCQIFKWSAFYIKICRLRAMFLTFRTIFLLNFVWPMDLSEKMFHEDFLWGFNYSF